MDKKFDQTELTALVVRALKGYIKHHVLSNSFSGYNEPSLNELHLKIVELKNRIENENLDIRLVSREY
jgi:hypothetical protein